MQTLEQLERVFRDIFNDDALVLCDSMTVREIPGWDSLAHINLMFAIESAFGMQFVGNELAELKNIGELKALLKQRGRTRSRQSSL
jgi:acyl carrier protein